MKSFYISILFLAIVFFSERTFAQVVDTPIVRDVSLGLINGRIVNINLQNVNGAVIADTRTKAKTSSNELGFFQLEVTIGDTISFNYPGLSPELRKVKNFKSKMNVILIKRKVDNLPQHSLRSDSSKAKKADDELYRILEKDAKLEGKWNY